VKTTEARKWLAEVEACPALDGKGKFENPRQSMRRKFPSGLWMGAAFGVAFAIAAIVLVSRGTGASGLVSALRMTARWSFLLFWVAYAGGALATLIGRAFKPLAEHGREFGLAYASAQLVHLSLVVWLFRIASSPPLTGKLLYFFLVAVVWTYLLAILSFGNLGWALGPKTWRAVRIFGVNYILLAFAYDFVPAAIHSPEHYGTGRLIQYAPFAATCVIAPVLVLSASAYRRLGMRYRAAVLGPAINYQSGAGEA
jgi:hypothetical protein